MTVIINARTNKKDKTNIMFSSIPIGEEHIHINYVTANVLKCEFVSPNKKRAKPWKIILKKFKYINNSRST